MNCRISENHILEITTEYVSFALSVSIDLYLSDQIDWFGKGATEVVSTEIIRKEKRILTYSHAHGAYGTNLVRSDPKATHSNILKSIVVQVKGQGYFTRSSVLNCLHPVMILQSIVSLKKRKEERVILNNFDRNWQGSIPETFCIYFGSFSCKEKVENENMDAQYQEREFIDSIQIFYTKNQKFA
ncbi:hypothetical protein X798_02940, partial [Onchocerca flexuosa]